MERSKVASIVLAILMAILAVLLTYCSVINVDASIKEAELEVRFEVVKRYKNTYIYVDKETNVQYVLYHDQAGRSGFTALLDSNGKPLLWKGEEVEPNALEEKAKPVEPKKPAIDVTPYNEAARYLAKTVWGEARGCSVTEQAAVIWCVLNRVDNGEGYSPEDVIRVVTAKNQFHGYKTGHPVTDEHYNLAMDVITRWLKEKAGENDVGRVLPKQYMYFAGDGRRNHFRDSWDGGNRWNWTLKSPYEE